MSLTRKVAFNTSVQIFGRVITTAISLVLVGTIARYFDITHFGKFTKIFAYTAFFSVIADFGFFNVLVRELAAGKKDPKKVINNVITLRSVFAFLVFLIGFCLAFFLKNYDHEVRLGIGVISLAQFWLSLNMTIVGVFQWRHRMDRAVLTDITSRIVILLTVLVMVKFAAPLIVIVMAYALGNFVNFAMSAVMVSRDIPVSLRFDRAYWRELAKITLPLGTIAIISYFYFHVDMIILTLMKGDFDVAIYGASYKIIEILLTLPGIFIGAVFPILTRYVVDNDPRTKSVIQRSFDFLAIVGVPLLAGVFLLAKPIIRLVAGDKYTVSAPAGLSFLGHAATSDLILQILVFALLLSFFSILFHTIIIALGKQSALVWPNVFFLIFNTALNYIFIPRYSYVASALITVVGEALVLVIPIFILKKHGVPLPTVSILLKVAIGTVVMSLAILALLGHSLILTILIAIVLYFSTMYLIGGIPKEMLLEIFHFRRTDLTEEEPK